MSGDCNIDLLKYDKITFVEDFLNIIFCNYYQPAILQPTRYIDKNRPSLIDNIFVNSLDLKATSGNLITKVSDHMPNFIILERKIHNNKKPNILKRNFKNFKESDYIKDIKDINFDFVDDGCQNIDSKYDLFQQNVLDIIQKHAPLQRLSKKRRKQLMKPWITNGILKSISIKNRFYKKFLKSKNPLFYERYKYYRDTLNKLIKSSKRLHYNSYFETFKNNSKKIWSAINEIINKSSKAKSNEISLITANGNILEEVANTFNEFFTNIARNLVNKLDKSKSHFTDYLTDSPSESIMLLPVTELEVFNQLNNLEASKSAGAYLSLFLDKTNKK